MFSVIYFYIINRNLQQKTTATGHSQLQYKINYLQIAVIVIFIFVIGIDDERTTAIITLLRNKIILVHSGRLGRFVLYDLPPSDAIHLHHPSF